MIVVTRYRVPAQESAEFLRLAAAALQVLVARPGCTGGQLGRAVDEPTLWVLSTTWESVGAYRRALSCAEVKLAAVPVMYRALDEPSAFETLHTWSPAAGWAAHDTLLAAGPTLDPGGAAPASGPTPAGGPVGPGGSGAPGGVDRATPADR